MARISASIPEDLKDALYQAATDDNQAISHIIVEALRAHFNREAGSPRAVVGQASGGSEEIRKTLESLVLEIRDLKEQLGSRTPPRGARFF